MLEQREQVDGTARIGRSDVYQPQRQKCRERADGGHHGMRRQAGHVQADGRKTAGQQEQADQVRDQQAVVELAAHQQRQGHERDEPADHRQEHRRRQKFAEDDLRHRHGRRHEQGHGLVAAFLCYQPHGEQRHGHHQHDRSDAEHRHDHHLGQSGGVRHACELCLHGEEKIESGQEYPGKDDLQESQHHPRERRRKQGAQFLPNDGADHADAPVSSFCSSSRWVSCTKTSSRLACAGCN